MSSRSDCEVTLRSGTVLSAAANVDLDDSYSFRSLVNFNVAVAPLHSTIRRLFLIAGMLALVVAVMFTCVSSRVVVDPIGRVIEHLRESERTGTLNNFDVTVTAAPEIRELMVGFNRAAAAIRGGQENLHAAYLEFVQSLSKRPGCSGSLYRWSQRTRMPLCLRYRAGNGFRSGGASKARHRCAVARHRKDRHPGHGPSKARQADAGRVRSDQDTSNGRSPHSGSRFTDLRLTWTWWNFITRTGTEADIRTVFEAKRSR